MKSAAIIDDELKFPPLSDEILRVFSDETSPEYEKLSEFLLNSKRIDNENAISDFIFSNDFIKDFLLTEVFIEFFEADFKTSLLAYKDNYIKSMEKFELISKVLQENGFKVKYFHQRPNENSDLERFQVIFMDFYMGDDNDNVENLSNYLGGIKGEPLIFLISSRTELNDLKIKFRKEAKISSLAFAIYSKDILSQDNAEIKINLILRQMIESVREASSFKQLILAFEKAHLCSLDKVKDCFWNLDYSFIQKLKSRTDNENNSFPEHLLSLLSHYNNYHLENNEDLCSSINELESVLNEPNKLACFSTDSEILSHDLDSSLFLTGRKPKVTTFETSETSETNVKQDSTDINIADILPFGSLLVNRDNNALIHCTQQCDLSRNIKRDDINLIFINALIVNGRNNTPQGSNYSIIPLPSTTFDKSSLLCINHKKILAIPAEEALKYLSEKQYINKAILREGAVRQYREKMFDEMSRIETPISSGNFLNVSLKLEQANSHPIEFSNEVGENRVVLNEFITNGKSTYHLIEQRNIEVIWWLKSNLNLDSIGLSIYELESILKDKLPAQKKQCNEYTENRKFIICFDKDTQPQGRDIILKITTI